MHRVAFKMQLFSGFEAEYKKRHDELWPELKQLLKDAGINDYSIFLDTTTNCLFAVMKAEDPAKLANLPSTPVMQKWWKYMADIMETNADNSPVQISLEEVFYLP
jgi:L-rhamnose mutarotase